MGFYVAAGMEHTCIKSENNVLQVPSTRAEWKQIAQLYEDLWQFPYCVGALGGKQVALMPPHDSEAQFRNYKGFF